MTTFKQKVHNAVKQIPQGKVMTYSGIAKLIGRPKAARAVGNVLNKNFDKTIPCHRVIKSDGRIGEYNNLSGDKTGLLKKEGVIIISGQLDLKKYRWKTAS
ncbi:MAG: MGMT family protein [bacterium]|nr:MGMT family protein [bacterium]